MARHYGLLTQIYVANAMICGLKGKEVIYETELHHTTINSYIREVLGEIAAKFDLCPKIKKLCVYPQTIKTLRENKDELIPLINTLEENEYQRLNDENLVNQCRKIAREIKYNEEEIEKARRRIEDLKNFRLQISKNNATRK